MALARLRSAAAFAVPLASADRSTRLAVRRTPARSSSSPAAFANGSAAAARSVIAASPGDIDYPVTQAQHPWMPGRARRPRSGTRRAGSAPPPSAWQRGPITLGASRTIWSPLVAEADLGRSLHLPGASPCAMTQYLIVEHASQ